MIPQTQSRVGKNGRCFSACLASILELNEADVPDFLQPNDADFYTAVDEWLAQFGLYYIEFDVDDVSPLGWHIICGVSPRGGPHAVVGLNGKFAWDPHPQDGTGRFLDEVKTYGVFIARQPEVARRN